MTTKIYYSTTETAKIIRTELKATFPEIKFSVCKADWGVINISFAGSSEIKQAVEELSWKYECGAFDGMSDIYNYETKKIGALEIDYSVKYIFVHCDYTDKEVAA
jgi:hypothetical protein